MDGSCLAQQIYDVAVNPQSIFSMADVRWPQAPVKFEDALGRVIPVPSEYTMGDLSALIRHRFREGPGSDEVSKGYFEVSDRRNSNYTMSLDSPSGLLPGLSFFMSILIDAATEEEKTCPIGRCGTRNTIILPGGGRRWYVTSKIYKCRGFGETDRHRH